MKKEIRVYVIDCNATDFPFRVAEEKKDWESIMVEAERLGDIYSLNGFQEAVNNNEVNLDNSFILIR